MSYDPSARFDAGKSSIDGGIFGGGAWADSARAVKPRNPYSRGTDFLGRLEQAEHRDTFQQQQMPYYAQQQQMQMQQQRQMIRSAPSQQQHAYSRFPPQQQQQQQPPKGILKRKRSPLIEDDYEPTSPQYLPTSPAYVPTSQSKHASPRKSA